MINEFPYDSTNTVNEPYLIERNNHLIIEDKDGNKLTASYIWSLNSKDREDLVEYVFNYYRSKGFPYNSLSDEKLFKEFKKLKNKDPNDVVDENGYIKNTSSLGNEIYKKFVWEKYYSSKAERRGRSIIDVFNNDDLLLKVIKNRMGYCISGEDGKERAYVFSMSGGMIIQGIKSTGFGSNISLFKPVIAKFLYKKYAKSKVLDFSSGWGARTLAAMSLDLEYYGIDPLTFSEINSMISFFNGNGFVVNGCSEDTESYKDIPMVDCIMSCPPYFDLEVYSDDDSQSINKFSSYEDWINIYWNNTVVNCLSKLEEDGYFIFVIKDKVGKYNIAEDMLSICEKNNLGIVDKIYYKTLNSHLSGKKQTGKKSKNSEIVYVMKKIK